MSNSVRPHRRQPTRLPCPWDSPGKNTGVGWHFLLQCMKVKSESEASQSCLTLSDLLGCSLPGSSVHGVFQARVLEWVPLPSLPSGTSGKESTCQCRRYKRHRFNPWVRKIPLSRKWQPVPVFLTEKSHGQKNLAGYSPWGHKEAEHDLATKQQQHYVIGKNLLYSINTQKLISKGMLPVN